MTTSQNVLLCKTMCYYVKLLQKMCYYVKLLQKMRSRDSLRKKSEHSKDINTWNLYKKSRNEVSNLLKQSKRDYFRTNLDSAKNDPKKTWKLINQLTSRSDNKCSNINRVEVSGVEISDTCEIAEAFNTHLTETGENLADSYNRH